ncbi:hypothetical protein CANCADRAFT_31350 [Tortispora caseinolytica NRRL Y-17796]|uniref:GPI transamidase subunit PIG-U n=1 Tax=Tortispora caseinolytica NRRL Y-17796 TaxID=767744 RepID=A0A1E4TF26_9ASCO|nr:hypothetical protein CANCADRAFT_31350 [Tortispora caseinolytica NRRL Y-17796]
MKWFAIIAALVGIRFLLFLYCKQLLAVLENNVAISTPLTSYQYLLEGLFYYSRNLEIYNGGIYHQSPILLYVMNLLDATGYIDLLSYMLWITLDVVSALALASMDDFRPLTAVIYLANPFTIASLLARSTLIFTSTAILMSLATAKRRRAVLAMTFLAVATHFSLYPAALLPPVMYMSVGSRLSLYSFAKTFFVFVAATSTCMALSYAIAGSWHFLKFYKVSLLFQELKPNIGIWWYFFVEMFDFFMPFFLSVFNLHVFIYSLPLTIRLRHDPLFAAVTVLGLHAMFKPYPSIGDISLYLSLLPLYSRIYTQLKYAWVALLALAYASILTPTFYHLWIVLGSGNANFFYAITLTYVIAMTTIISDTLWAVLRLQFDDGASSKQVIQT